MMTPLNTHEKTSFTERLLWAMNARSVSQTALAKAINVRPQSIQYLCNPNQYAQGSKYTAMIADCLGVSSSWLATGEGLAYALLGDSKSAPNLMTPTMALDGQDLSHLCTHLDQIKAQFSGKFPSQKSIQQWADQLVYFLFPIQAKVSYASSVELTLLHAQLHEMIRTLIAPTQTNQEQATHIAHAFITQLPQLRTHLVSDIQAILSKDPAANSEEEIILCYPGFLAVAIYRVAHALWLLQLPLLPRMLAAYALSKTGIDIHPAANIGQAFFIDHGMGVVIGETTSIGEHVSIYQGVTLGALQRTTEDHEPKRHPTIGDGVTIYANATILGGKTIIGEHAIIGGNVWLTESVPPHTFVHHESKLRSQYQHEERIR